MITICADTFFSHESLSPFHLEIPRQPHEKNEKKQNFLIFFSHSFSLSFSVLPNTKTLHITSLIVPAFVDVRDVVMLSCSYNIGTQKLNSVKWYKNDKEFYRWEFCVTYQHNLCECTFSYLKNGMTFLFFYSLSMCVCVCVISWQQNMHTMNA